MRALKGLVIGMGILILIGFGVVIVAVIQRFGGDGASPPKVAARPSVPFAGAPGTPLQGPSSGPAQAAFGDIKVQLPAGARVAGASTDAGRLVVQLRLADGAMRVLVIDLATGRRLGTIDLAP